MKSIFTNVKYQISEKNVNIKKHINIQKNEIVLRKTILKKATYLRDGVSGDIERIIIFV